MNLMPMRSNHDYIILDTETTGLPHGTQQPYICQIAAIRFHRNGIVDTYTAMVDPEIPANQWDQDSIKVTGIGPEDVKSAAPTVTVLSQLGEFMVGTISLGAYNLPFDVGVIAAELERNGLQYNFPWPPRHFDVAPMSEAYITNDPEGTITTSKKGVKQPKLEEIYKHLFGESMVDAHDAMGDVQATLKVYFEIMGWEPII